MPSWIIEGDLIEFATDSKHDELIELMTLGESEPIARYGGNKHVMRNGSIEIIGIRLGNYVGRHRLSTCWAWERNLRFKVNLHGGAFG